MKKIIFIVLSLLFSFTVYSKPNISFSTSFFSGIKFGEISKSIYLNNKDTKVSQLDWEQKPVYQFGIKTFFSISNFETLLTASFGIPLETGKMYDSDWNLSGIKKTYTISQCDLEKDFNTCLSFACKTPSLSFITIKPEVQLQYLYTSFHAHDGYGWYGAYQYAKVPRDYDVAWNDPLARKAKKIRDIDYFRHSLFSFCGLQCVFTPVEKLNISTGFYVSPFIYMYSVDTHYRSEINTHYLDTQTGYFSKFKTALKCSYQVSDILQVFVDLDYIFGFSDYGDLYADEYSDDLTLFEKQPTSAKIWNLNINSGLTIKFK